jgi:hypothetical protein
MWIFYNKVYNRLFAQGSVGNWVRCGLEENFTAYCFVLSNQRYWIVVYPNIQGELQLDSELKV